MILHKYILRKMQSRTASFVKAAIVGCSLSLTQPLAQADDFVVDILGPQIEHTGYTKEVKREKLYSSILAKVSDDFGVYSVKLYYRLSGHAQFSDLKMQRNASNGAYFAPLKLSNLPEDGAVLEYYFEAIDVNENKSTKLTPNGQLYRLEIAKSEKRKGAERLKSDICRYNIGRCN